MFISDWIEFWARCQPLHPAVVTPERVITYSVLANAIGSVRARIDTFGLDKSAPVAVFIDHPAKMLAVGLALVRSGYIAVPVSQSSLGHLKAAGISTVLAVEGGTPRELRRIQVEDDWLTGPAPARETDDTGRRQAIFFTSGSTGVPKAPIFDFLAQSQWSLYYSSLVAGISWSRVIVRPGLGSGFGFRSSCMALMQGRTACYANSPAAVFGLLSTFRAELIIASTQQAADLINYDDRSPGPLDSLQAIWVGGALLHRELLAQLRAKLCRRVISAYASTEGSIAAFAPDMYAVESIPGAVGYVAPWAQIEVVDSEDRVLRPGAEGIVRYRTEVHAKTLRSGAGTQDWFYPGDVGAVTAEGIVCIYGRTDDRLNLGGVKSSAESLDFRLCGLPEVKDGAVCALPDARGVDVLCVAVVPARSCDKETFRLRLASEIFKLPVERVDFVNSIPRTAEGKVMRNELRATLRESS
ncbi:MAG: acyl-CoA synthetase [Hyphomicrobiales bacterium]|nr:acyl-CoA synthetase [Hyphomicrobiales bacterium]